MKANRPSEVIERLATFLQTPLDVILHERQSADLRENALKLFKITAEGSASCCWWWQASAR